MSGRRTPHTLLLLALAALAAGCSRASAAQPSEDSTVFSVGSPKVIDTSFDREYVGEVHAFRYAELRSRLKGVIESVTVDEGAAVKKDQLLFTLSARELHQEQLQLRAAMKSAEAELKLARLEQENTQLLFEKSIVSDAEMALSAAKADALSARLEASKAQANQVSINLSYAKVRAPFDGVINRIPRKTGSVVSEDELLTTLADTSQVYVYFRVSEREYLEYAAGISTERPKEVAFKLANGTLHPEKGVIDTVESEIDRQTGNLAFRARFANAGKLLKHGSSGKIVIRTALQAATLVPQKSTFEVQGRTYLYVVDAESRAHAREILTKQRIGDAFVVASGIEARDRFILEGVQKVRDGMTVQTKSSN